MSKVTIYNRDRVKVAYCEKAFDIGYRLQPNALWRAWFSLTLDDPKNDEIGDLYYAEIWDGDTRIDLFRVISTKKRRSGGKAVITYQCEHVLGTLMDDMLIGVFNAGPGTSAAINTVLAEQTTENWVLNTQDFARNFYHDWEDVTLLKALFSIPTRFTNDHVWTWDTTTYPWRLNLETVPATVSAKIRYQRELKDIEKTSDARYLYTRLYAFGFGVGAGQVDMLAVDQMAEGRPEFTSGSTEFTVGETLTGADSGETCVVASFLLESGTWGGGDAQGPLFVTGMSGAFTDGEDLNGSAAGANCASVDLSLDHVNATAIVTYGIISRNWTDQRYTVAANLHEQAVARVDKNSTPRTTYRLSAMDFNRLDGTNQYVLGDLVRIYDSELGIDVNVRVTLVSKGDVEGRPGDITIQLATEEAKFVNFGDIVYADDLDGVKDGTFGKVLSTSISAGKILLTSGIVGDLDDIDDGATYSRVFTTDITAGHILLSEATGDLDDIGDGTTYSRIATTEITAGKIVLVAATASININDTTFGNDGIQLQYNAGNPRVYIGDGANAFIQHDGTKLTWKAANTELDASGNLTCTGGTIGGWTLGGSTLANGTDIILDAANKKISINSATFGNDGIQLDYNAGNPRAYFGDGSNAFVNFDGTKITWKAANTELDASGNLTCTGGTIGGWTLGGSTLANGTDIILDAANKKISINSATFGNDGIQLDYNAGNPRAYFGDGSNAFVNFDGTKITWKAANTELDASGNLVATSVTLTGEINATAGYFGDGATRVVIEAAGINVGNTGSIRGGASGYNSGTGFWLGYTAGAYKLFIGNSSGNKLLWTGSALEVTGKITATVAGSDIPWGYISGVDVVYGQIAANAVRTGELYIDGDIDFEATGARQACKGINGLYYDNAKNEASPYIKLNAGNLVLSEGTGRATITIDETGLYITNGAYNADLTIASGDDIVLQPGADNPAAVTGVLKYINYRIHDGNAVTSWTEVNASAQIGSRRCMLLMRIENNGGGAVNIRFRPSDEGGQQDPLADSYPGAFSTRIDDVNEVQWLWILTGSSGRYDWDADLARSVYVNILAYIACA